MELNDDYFMAQAIAEATCAAREGEIPIGAVIVSGGKIIARGHNMTEALNDVTAHAEMLAISAAQSYLGGKYLDGCTLYVTVEPCTMCAGAIGWSRVGRIVVGCRDEKRGYTSVCRSEAAPLHPRSVISFGVREAECREIMQDFFRGRR